MGEEKNGYVEQKGGDFWKPEEEGDILEGVVVSIYEGDFETQLVIEKKDNKRLTSPSHKVLQSKLAKIAKGDKIGILYEGEETPTVKGYSPTKIYKVFKKE